MNPYREDPNVPDADHIHVKLGNVERRGIWTCAQQLDIHVVAGNCELDFREAVMSPGLTTIHCDIKFGNLEMVVPPGMAVELKVVSIAGNVMQHRDDTTPPDPTKPRLVVIGRVKAGNCEVWTLGPGETERDVRSRRRHEHRRRHREAHRRHWAQMKAEREMWVRTTDRQRWMPWWLASRMRRRMFSWFTMMFIGGISTGYYLWPFKHWWYFPITAFFISSISGAVAFRLTRPLTFVIKAATDIGDGKLETRIDPYDHTGEMRLLAQALNDMATKIQTQLSDQRQLLAAVSHELRTPLGHMRVLVETARDTGDMKSLSELEREVLVLDDLVGRLLASSRLEFGQLDRRDVDLGELTADVAQAAGVSVDVIAAEGDVKASIDPTLIRRAVANLVDNARVHGGGVVVIKIDRRGGQIAIEVDDNGPGVPADKREEAFRAFSPSTGCGLGLGLALVSRIAVAHGGGAWINDRPGGGARIGFTVSRVA
ncbi:MAG TPA: ATP-binding protein [Kofleriaceae bacterium]